MSLSEEEWEEYYKLSQEIGGTMRKCKKCGTWNTHRLDDKGEFVCDGEWEEVVHN